MTPHPPGFTLIELLVVIAIVALISVVAVPLGVRSVENATLRSDARKLVSVLRQMQQDARAQQTTVTLSTGEEAATARLRLLAPDAVVDLPGNRKSLSFYPDGTSSGGIVRLSEHGRSLDLEVAWMTGAVVLRAAP